MYVCAFSSFLRRQMTRAQDATAAGLAGGVWPHEPAFVGMLAQVTISYQALQITEEGYVQPYGEEKRDGAALMLKENGVKWSIQLN